MKVCQDTRRSRCTDPVQGQVLTHAIRGQRAEGARRWLIAFFSFAMLVFFASVACGQAPPAKFLPPLKID
ncbi:MAG: hypothetical protein AAGJ83_12010, partial [Planctomycetota bacterium]